MSYDHKNSPSFNKECKNKKRNVEKELFSLLFKRPMSRRMAATELGFPDQTYMVTDTIKNWLKYGRAEIVGSIKCKRSGKFVQGVTTNPKLFRKSNSNQTKLF
jgi:hypothetical protein